MFRSSESDLDFVITVSQSPSYPCEISLPFGCSEQRLARSRDEGYRPDTSIKQELSMCAESFSVLVPCVATRNYVCLLGVGFCTGVSFRIRNGCYKSFNLLIESAAILKEDLLFVCEKLLSAEDLLNTLDTGCGDGDAGTTMVGIL